MNRYVGLGFVGAILLLAGAPLFATLPRGFDGASADEAPAKPTDKENDKDKDKEKKDKPIESLKDLMARVQRQSSETLMAFRRQDSEEALAGIKRVEEYASKIESWMPSAVSSNAARKARFLEFVAAVRKSNADAIKLLETPDLTKAYVEYVRGLQSCTNCHNEFRPKR
jgi:hypothetical protein